MSNNEVPDWPKYSEEMGINQFRFQTRVNKSHVISRTYHITGRGENYKELFEAYVVEYIKAQDEYPPSV